MQFSYTGVMRVNCQTTLEHCLAASPLTEHAQNLRHSNFNSKEVSNRNVCHYNGIIMSIAALASIAKRWKITQTTTNKRMYR